MSTAILRSALDTAASTKALHLSGLGLTSIPSQVWDLTNLVRLDISDNELTEVPADIGKLTKLQELWVNGNPIRSMPPDIQFCQGLRFLDLRDTEVFSLPKEVSRLPRLANVSLSTRGLKPKLASAYGAGTKSLLQHLAHKDEKLRLREMLRKRLDVEVYREVSNTADGSSMLDALVKQVMKEFADFEQLRLLIRNAERLFPDDLEVADAAAIRKTFVKLQRDNQIKKLAADVELKLRALYFNRIRVERVEGFVKAIYAHVTRLEDMKFLLHFATQLFPDNPDDIDGAAILQGIKDLRQRRAEEKAAAVATLAKALRALYPDREPSDVEGVATTMSKLIKGVTDIKQLAADAGVFFPSDYTALRPRRVQRNYLAAQEEKAV